MSRPRDWPPRIGMPGFLYLHMFAEVAEAFFGETIYHVGSSAAGKSTGTGFRDVDVRAMLPDDRYEAEGYGHIGGAPVGSKWAAINLAFSALGEKMTGLPIDFQVQSVTEGNREEGARWALAIRHGGGKTPTGVTVPATDVDALSPEPSR